MGLDVTFSDEPRYVFIVTTYRTGSTLLLGLLNRIPGYYIRGENYAALSGLTSFRLSLERTNRRVGATPANPWYGSQLDTLAAMQDAGRVWGSAMQGESGARVVGFKEVRYTAETLADDVATLRQLFPGCRLVFLTRDAGDTAKEQKWSIGPSSLTEGRILALYDKFKGFTAPDCFHLTYDELAAGSVAGLLDFLGESLPAEALEDCLSRRHSYGGTVVSRQLEQPTHLFVSYSCRRYEETRLKHQLLTWPRRLPAWAAYLPLTGDGSGIDHARGFLRLKCPDDYRHLIDKTQALFDWFIAERSEEWLVKVDDDVWLSPAAVSQLRCPPATYGGFHRVGGADPWASGTCYFIHRSVIARLPRLRDQPLPVNAAPAAATAPPEDHAVFSACRSIGVSPSFLSPSVLRYLPRSAEVPFSSFFSELEASLTTEQSRHLL